MKDLIYDDSLFIIGLRIKSVPTLASAIKIIRKYITLSIGEIQNIIGTDTFIYSCQCHEERNLGIMIKLYKELERIGASLEILEGNAPISFELLQNQLGSVRNTRKGFDDLSDDEI